MAKIWKYPLAIGTTSLVMPKGAKILSVKVQNEDPVLWAEVDPDAPTVTRYFTGATTGWTLPATVASGTYLGTCLLEGGRFVMHVYEHAMPVCGGG